MAEAADTLSPSEQGTIELPNGVVLTGMGDPDAIRESLEDRHDELHPAPAPVATTPAAPVTEPTKSRGQKRFDALTAEREAATRRADAADARIKELEAKLAAPVAQPATQPAATVTPAVATSTIDAPSRPKPTENDDKYKTGATYADFVEDLADWKAEQRELKLRRDLDAQSTQRIEADRASRTRMDYVNGTVFPAGRAAYPDFDAVLNGNTTPTPAIVHEAILRMEHPEHVLYTLAKDSAKLDAVIALASDPLKLGIAIAQCMPRESVAPPASTAPVVRTTNAPAPMQPVGAGTRTTSPTLQELADKGDNEGYSRARAAGQTH